MNMRRFLVNLNIARPTVKIYWVLTVKPLMEIIAIDPTYTMYIV